MMAFRPWLLAAVLVQVSLCISELPAQRIRPAPLNQRAVDLIALSDGPALYGVILSEQRTGTVSLAIRREWLDGAAPAVLGEIDRLSRENAERNQQTLTSRLTDWRSESVRNPRLKSFLDSEIRRRGALDLPSQPRFVVLRQSSESIRRIHRQPRMHRQVAIAAFQSGLNRVEERAARDLIVELRDRSVNWEILFDQWSRGLQRERIDNEQEWAARKAIVEFALGENLEFRGTKDVWWEGKNQQQVVSAELIKSLLQSRLNALLEVEPVRRATENESRPDPLKQAIEKAVRRGVRGFRVTWLDLDQGIRTGQAVVRDEFHARMPDQSWSRVWTNSSSTRLDAVETGDLDSLRNDPRIGSLLQAATLLGTGGGLVDQSLRFGAASKRSLDLADTSFFTFRDRMTRQLDSPAWPPLNRGENR